MTNLLQLLPADGWQRLLVDALWQSTAICAAGFLIAKMVRHSAARAWVLLLTLTACLTTPAISAVVRTSGWGLLHSQQTATAPAETPHASAMSFHSPVLKSAATIPTPSLPSYRPIDASGDIQAVPSTSLLSSIQPREKTTHQLQKNATMGLAFTWIKGLAALWLAISTVLVLRMLLGAIAARRLLASAAGCSNQELQRLAVEAARQVNLRSTPILLCSDRVRSPMILAFGQPRLIIPASASNLDAQIDWRATFAHELAHVVRRDGWSRLWAELVMALVPIQPLVWLVRREFFTACEEACDDLAVASGNDPVELAATLTAWINCPKPLAATGAIGMSSTKNRVIRLLALRETPKTNLDRFSRWLSMAMMIILVTGLAVAQSESAKSGRSKTNLAFPPVTTPPPSDLPKSVPPPHGQAQHSDEMTSSFDLNREIDRLHADAVDYILRTDSELQNLARQHEALSDAIEALRHPSGASGYSPAEHVATLEIMQKECDRLGERIKARFATHGVSGTSREDRLVEVYSRQLQAAEERLTKNDRVLARLKSIGAQEDLIKHLQERARLQSRIDNLRNHIIKRQTSNSGKPKPSLASYTTESQTTREERPLPVYVIEPPDVLLINGIRLAPKKPTRIAPLDLVFIEASGVLANRGTSRSTITGAFAVDSAGEIVLGSAYGSVKVSGLTRREAQEAVTKLLEKSMADPQVALTLDERRVTQGISGEHIVGPDGNVNLGQFGKVRVSGFTLDEATAAIEKHLGDHFDSPKVSVDVFAYNSKVYYVIVQVGEKGDNIHRFPITGNETVLDAVAQVTGLSGMSKAKIWIARPTPDGKDQVLNVNWAEITSGGSTATNYQVMPGDRVFVTSAKPDVSDSVKPQPLK